MELNCLIPANTDITTENASNKDTIQTELKDDIFNLNSFVKEEYLFSKRKKERYKSSSSRSRSSSSYESSLSYQNEKKSSKKRSRRSTSSSKNSNRNRRSSTSSLSSSWSENSNSKCRLKSKVVLVNLDNEKCLSESKLDENSRYSNSFFNSKPPREDKQPRPFRSANHFMNLKPRLNVRTPPLPPECSNILDAKSNDFQHVDLSCYPNNESMSTYLPRSPFNSYSNQTRFDSYSYYDSSIQQKTDFVRSPLLNQHQELSYTVDCNPVQEVKKDDLVEIKKQDESNDLLTFRNKLQEQLKQMLFDSNELESKEKFKSKIDQNNSKSSVNDSSFMSSSSSNHHHHKDASVKKQKSKKEKKNKKKKRRNSTTSDKTHKKRLKKEPDCDEDEEEYSVELSDNDDSNSYLRRSVRIKTIKTNMENDKVMKIAEKIKKNSQSDENNASSQIEIGLTNIKQESNISNNLNQEETNELMPIKVKDRWRRFSEKETESLINAKTASQPNTTSVINLNIVESKEVNSVLKSCNNLLNSPSSTISSSVSSPRAYKKLLLNKAVNELAIIQGSEKDATENTAENLKEEKPPVQEDFEWIKESIQISKCGKQSKKSKDAKKMVCDCSTSQQERSLGIVPCGDDCLNRLLMIECGSNCPCEDYCTNKNFKNKNNAPIWPFKTELKGWGLKANTDLKANTFLIEYVGEIIDVKEFKKRFEKYVDENIEHFYFMSLQNDLFIDSTKKGNISRFFNHSCEPNCETQKWTVNGELRIGFFTRRAIGANEELTFDYQFQTVGKKQQKCYCGSERCRGYLGVAEKSKEKGQSGGNMLDYIWENSDSSDQDSEEDSEQEDDDDDKCNQTVHSEEDNKEKHNIKKAAHSKDYDLNRQINSIKSLTTKENILKLCQLMFRSENIENRIDILNLLLNANSELSLKLFMDYHGLKLLWGWMIDIDNLYETKAQLECKLKIIKVLSSLTIKNRTTVEECKLLVIVKRWTENTEHNRFRFKSIEMEHSKDTKEENEVWVNCMILDVVENALNLADKTNVELNEQIKELAVLTKDLYEKWNNLKVAFKIPKKQRIEERKEHEREMNDSNKTDSHIQANEQAYDDKETNNYNYKDNQRNHYFNQHRSFNRPKSFTHRFHHNKFNRYHSNNRNTSQNSNSNLTKEQRRQLFELQVKKEEEEAAARAAEEAAAALAAEQAQAQQHELRWMFDKNLNQWIQTYVPITNHNHNINESAYYQQQEQQNGDISNHLVDLNASSMVNPLKQQSSNIQNHLNNLNLSDSHFQDLKQAVKQFMPNSDMLENDLNKTNHSLLLDDDISSSGKQSSHAKLPSDWKCKKNKKGQIYYFNVVTKQSQWHFPRLKSSVESPNKKQDETPASLTNEATSPADSTSKPKSNKEQTMVNSNETSSSFKQYKDQFREKLSKLVIKLLEVYLKEDCKCGRIRSTDDFKHLARKFTHTIMEKEMSRVTKLEELDLNKRVKIKTQEYVSQYMNKFKGGYSRKSDQV